MARVFFHADTFRASFENRCIQLLVDAYNSSIIDKAISVTWNENDITAELHQYIGNNPKRSKWHISSNVEHHLPKEVVVKSKGFAARFPRIDLRFVVWNSRYEHCCYLEAKNLKENDSSLKFRYIKTGIDNFISKKYENGFLVGYLLEGVLNNTIEGINKLLTKDGRDIEVLKKQKSPFFDCYYESTHAGIKSIKHFIFDFTNQ